MTTVWFVRHAQPNLDNHDDLTRELSAKGLRDRGLLDAFFADVDFHAVLSSPFRRQFPWNRTARGHPRLSAGFWLGGFYEDQAFDAVDCAVSVRRGALPKHKFL